MDKGINLKLGWISVFVFAVTRALSDNITVSPSIVTPVLSDNITVSTSNVTPVTLPRRCQGSDGQFHNIGDVWKPGPDIWCSCEPVVGIRCLTEHVVHLKPTPLIACRDQQQQIRNPGDEWLINSWTKCTCTQNGFIRCSILREPACMDSSGKIRSNKETWMKNDCIKCACGNGSINCNRYVVNITYGLFEVKTYPICERCVILMTVDSIAACSAFFGTAKRWYHYRPKMFRCSGGGHYIWDSHRCNGILECPDGSDEKDCENKKCKDEKGAVYLIKSSFGWQVSPYCLKCHCAGGLLTCKKTFVVSFPGDYHGYYSFEENCTQPSCKVSQFIRDNKDKCQGVEIIQNKGILVQGQTWNFSGCEFYFPGSNDKRGAATCPPMIRPVCYVYNGAVCCASHCPALEKISKQMRGSLSVCSNGRQLISPDIDRQCQTSNCLRDFSMRNCTAEITCQDEEFNKYFEGSTWSVGDCIECSCNNRAIECTRKLEVLTSRGETISDHCSQTECNVARYIEKNKGVCKACRWNDRVYYDGDHWKENEVDFYCVYSRTAKKIRPGCYVERDAVKCTGAIEGIRNLSLISKEDLFLCDSGDQILRAEDRCDLRMDCYDFSDEKDCRDYFCQSELHFGLLWPRTKTGQKITTQCSLVDSVWTGTFSSTCEANWRSAVWSHDQEHGCGCERKYLLEHFKPKIQEMNETNFMRISTEFIGSHIQFKNKGVFFKMLKDLFGNVTTIISPITTTNSDLALQFSEKVVQILINKNAYYVSPLDSEAFCQQPDLARERLNLVNRVLEFLRTAPNNTAAYSLGLVKIQPFFNPKTVSQVANFRSDTRRVWIFIVRTKLILQLNKAPLVTPRIVTVQSVRLIKPTRTANNSASNYSTEIIQERNITAENRTDELSNEEIKAILAANNCPRVTYDKEKDTFKIHSATVTNKHDKIQQTLELVLLCVSIAAVVLSLILLSIIRVKKSERLFVHKNLLFSLGLGNLVYVLDILLFSSRKDHVALCCFVAVIQHYLHTSLFTWMLVEGINLYVKLVKVFTVNKQYLAYLAVGWGTPAVIVGLIAAIRPSTFDMGEILYGHVTCGSFELSAEIDRHRCWINGSLWIYKGPVLAILLINVVFFVIILRVVFGKIASKYGKHNVDAARRGARSIVALLPLLGVTWLLGFFVEFHDAVTFAFILVNSTMGVVFCIFHCILDDQVRDALRAVKIRKKKQADQKTGTTAVSNPSTPFVDKTKRTNEFTYPENRVDLIGITRANQDETRL